MNFEHLDALREAGRGVSVLFAEDDVNIRELYGKFLGKLFQNVVLAEDGSAALKKFETEPFVLLMTDIAMPIMNGVDLAKAALRINPDQCIIFVSAFNDEEMLERVRSLNPCHVIHKPFTLKEMVEILYAIIVEGRGRKITPVPGAS